jgi:hypothetical protein
MSVPDYPALSPAQKPEQEGFRREPAYDPVLRPEFENGVEASRARHTQVPWTWSYHYRGLSTANRDTLMTFWRDTVLCGASVFRWTDPSNCVSYYVRYASMPKCELEPDGTGTWRLDEQLRQAIGTFS